MDQLPKVFRDAMEVCRALGLRCLWVDALCIIRSGDSQKDWEVESAKMRDVYWNCQLSISAACATRPEDGLLIQKPTGLLRPMVYEQDGVIWELKDEDTYATEISRSPLSKRAWALQERMLPHRTLIFGKHELFWECQEQRVAEYGRAPRWSRGALPRLRVGQVGGDFSMLICSSIVQNYSSRSLTCPQKDKIIALGAVAEHIASIFDDKHSAGIFESHLPASLLWSTFNSELSHRPKTYRAPSWSWASVDGEVVCEISIVKADITYLSTVLDIKTDLVDKANRIGQVCGGSITLSGLLASLDCFRVDCEVNIDYDTSCDPKTGLKNMSYFLTAKEHIHRWSWRVRLSGLAVKKVEGQGPNVYKRMGHALHNHKVVFQNEDEILARFKECTITLV